MGEIAGDLHRVADSLASSAQITDGLQDVSGNCAAVVTCLSELQATTANLVSEVQTLTVAVQAKTAVIQEEGRQRNRRHNHTRQLRMQAQTNLPYQQFHMNIYNFLYALDKINQNPYILPNITLGYHLIDSCLDTRRAVSSILKILSGPEKTVPNYTCTRHGKLAGVIGDHFSTTTIPIAQILGLYKYTQISYGSTDYTLSNRQEYPHVFRTVQNNHIYYSIVAEILNVFGWTWVGIFVSDNDTGDEELQILKRYLAVQEICSEFILEVNSKEESWFRMFVTLKNTYSRVGVLCGSFTVDFLIFLAHFETMNNEGIIILPPHYASVDDLTNGMKTSALQSEMALLQNLYDNDLSFSYNDTIGGLIMTMKQYLSVGVSSRVYYAVEAMAKALHDMNVQQKDITKRKINQLYHYISKIIYTFDMSDSVPFFNDIGEFVYHYKIINWVKDEFYFVPIDVGNYSLSAAGQQFYIDAQAITWNKRDNKIPVSRCSEICQPGTRKQSKSRIHSCCHDCVPCSEGEISNTTDSKNCIRCLEEEWPNEKKDRCIPKLVEFLSYSDDMSTVFASFSVLLCLVILFIIGIFISYVDTAIIKANNRSLSFVLLVCILLSFLCVFLFLGRPRDITCTLRVTTFGTIFSLAVSCLLAKTIMVYIAFTATKPGSYWRKWIGVTLPNFVALLLTCAQGTICLIWLSTSPPFSEMDTHSYQDKIVIQCNEGSVIGFYSVLGYMGFLAAVSFVLAFMVRTLPDSFNEAKYITFSMLVFCSVWISMIPAYLSTKGKYTVAVEIFAILASSAGLLSCIFFPKCFIILFRPGLNTQTDLLSKKNRQFY
ncbi:extracellular calcium-sensing receptor-like [Rana temporaria]|uniref:extracellular calcium-sensing receptor-like n=1 Tax=Rana temporaria TaxID=8407 RepID=UPI001AAD173A|nr:extracellular calcium-sensing receptor-like [Rana temporaria]